MHNKLNYNVELNNNHIIQQKQEAKYCKQRINPYSEFIS
jgi:hypothetical protein